MLLFAGPRRASTVDVLSIVGMPYRLRFAEVCSVRASGVGLAHPYWWGAVLAKAVIDRVPLPGFGCKYYRCSMGWEMLLAGRTADVIVSSDTPPLIDALVYRRPGRRGLKNQVLRFCGIETNKIVQSSSVRLASTERIAKWIKRAEPMG